MSAFAPMQTGPAGGASNTFDARRAEMERRRLQIEMARNRQQILAQRAAARRAGRPIDTADLQMQRLELGDQMRTVGEALRPQRQMVTEQQVAARRADLARQGLEQASMDRARAAQPISPDAVAGRREQIRSAMVAGVDRRPGANVPMPADFMQTAGTAAMSQLAGQREAGIMDAERRQAAFVDFGFTPEEAAARAEQANRAAVLRNTERAAAQARLAQQFADADRAESEAAARAAEIAQAEREARLAAIAAETRMADSVLAPQPEDPLAPLEENLRRATLERQLVEQRALRDAAMREELQAQASTTDPTLNRFRNLGREVGELEPILDPLMGNVRSAIERATGGGYSVAESEANAEALNLALLELRELPDATRQYVARNLLTEIAPAISRNPEGGVFDFLSAAVGNPARLDDRLRANDVMRSRARQAIDEIRQMAGLGGEASAAPSAQTGVDVPGFVMPATDTPTSRGEPQMRRAALRSIEEQRRIEESRRR